MTGGAVPPAADPRSGRVPPIVEMGATFLKHNLVRPCLRRPFLPTTLLVYVTYRCNARCSMCGIWRESAALTPEAELSPGEIRAILSDPLFRRIRYLNLNGGEPALRGDLVEFAAACLDRLPRLEQVSLGTSGLLPERAARAVERMAPLLAARGVTLSVCLSIHGTGEVLARMYGIPDAEARIARSLDLLDPLRERLGFRLHASCVLTDDNLGGMDDLVAWTAARRVPVHFFIGEVRQRFRNRAGAGPPSRFLVTGENVPALAGRLRGLASRRSLREHHAYRYAALADMLDRGAHRKVACHYEMGGLILGSRGELFYCPQSREVGNCRNGQPSALYTSPENLAYRRELIESTCKICPPRTFNRVEAEKDALRFLCFLAAGRLGHGPQK